MDEQGSLPLESTLSQIDRMANELRNNVFMDRMENSGSRHVRRAILPNPSNGVQNHGNETHPNLAAQSSERFDGSPFMMPIYRNLVQSTMTSDNESLTTPQMLNSTQYSTIQASNPNRIGNIAGTPSLAFDSPESTITGIGRLANDLRNIGHMDPSSISRTRDPSEKNRAVDISVTRIDTQSSCSVSQNPSGSKDNPAMIHWMSELKRYWCYIEEQTRSSLKLIKEDRVRSGLPFDDKFKEHFLRSAYAKILIVFEQFLVDECWFVESFDTTFVTTDTEQRDDVMDASIRNSDDARDSESRNVHVLIHHQNQRGTAAEGHSHSPAANRDQLSANLSVQNDSVDRPFDSEHQHSASQSPEMNIHEFHDHAAEFDISGQCSMATTPADANDVIGAAVDVELTFMNGEANTSHNDLQLQPRMLSNTNIETNPVEITINGSDCEQRQNADDEPTAAKEVSNQPLETIALISDQEEVVNGCGNDKSQNVTDIGGQSQRRKRKLKNAVVSGNLKKKSKLSHAADTVKRHKCDYCDYSSTQKWNLTRHIRTHTDERPYGCVVCKKRFKLKENRDRHMKTHRDMFAFQCSNCRQGFSNDTPRQVHESRCKAKGYECHLCKRDFIRKHHLIEHIRSHTGEKLHCPTCRKQFDSNRGLELHMKTHGNLFRFHCSKCRQGFTDEKLWKRHESRCKFKQFECYLCNKQFYHEKSNLLSHMRRMHTGEKPFGCSDCAMRFCSKSNLTNHTKCHHKKAN